MNLWPRFLPTLLECLLATDQRIVQAAAFGVQQAAKIAGFASFAAAATNNVIRAINHGRDKKGKLETVRLSSPSLSVSLDILSPSLVALICLLCCSKLSLSVSISLSLSLSLCLHLSVSISLSLCLYLSAVAASC